MKPAFHAYHAGRPYWQLEPEISTGPVMRVSERI